MSDFDTYKSRLHLRGSTNRERELYYEKRELASKAINSLSCKDCLVNGVPQKLVIDDGTLPYYKNVKSLPDEYFNAGDLVEWTGAMWLIVSCDWDKEVYTYGKAQQCNYLLKWQNADAEVIERWSVVLSASKYNNGQLYNNVIVVGSNQLMVYLPIDEETLKLRSDKRIMVDFNTELPKCYDITRVDTVTMGYDGTAEPRYDGKGCILLVLTETEINPDVDRIDLMLCDYIDPNDIPHPSPINITFSGSPSIRIGGRKTFTAETENEVVFSLINSALLDGKLTMEQTGNKCVVKCANDSALVGATFKVEVAGGGVRSELLVDVIGAV
ncbi:MAG: hypothetical protein LC100_00340 [Chitinophagales bacterium]|nr:hypothetical protein [Chitinophagales bacterium]